MDEIEIVAVCVSLNVYSSQKDISLAVTVPPMTFPLFESP